MHMVTCIHCRQKFDRDKQPFVQVSERRYAHPECHQNQSQEYEKKQKDLKALEEYIKKLFKVDTIPIKIRKQINDYVTNHNYSYSGILKSLVYFYDVQGHSTEKSNGGIGIVPYTYDAAFNYYLAIWSANERNENKNIEELLPKEETLVKISSPKRKPLKKSNFAFLMEDTE